MSRNVHFHTAGSQPPAETVPRPQSLATSHWAMFTPVRPNVPFLYKYSSAEHLDWLESILLRHELYFPNPRQLNDPKDARPRLIQPSRDALISFLTNDFLHRNRRESPAILAAGLRKVLDGVSAFGTDRLLAEMSRLFVLEMEQHRIYSLTTRADNDFLWSRYANDRTGSCLEFRNDGLFAMALGVGCVDAVELDVTDSEQVNALFLFQKTNDYRREEEVRIVLFPRGRPAIGHSLRICCDESFSVET